MPKEEKDDLRSRRTRKLLQRALVELLADRDFNEITVQDIAERAEVNRATFYAHFDDKYDLLNQWVQERFQESLMRNLPPSTPPSKDSLRVLILTVCEFLVSFTGNCIIPKPGDDKSIILRQVQTCVYDVILQWLNTVSDEPEPHVSVVRARMVSWAIFGSALQWASDSRKPYTAEQLADEIMPLLAPSCDTLMTQEDIAASV